MRIDDRSTMKRETAHRTNHFIKIDTKIHKYYSDFDGVCDDDLKQ